MIHSDINVILIRTAKRHLAKFELNTTNGRINAASLDDHYVINIMQYLEGS